MIGRNFRPGLELCTRVEGDVVVVVCSGRLVNENAPHLRDHAKGAIPREKRVVLE
jgi:hypothetical protein